MLIGTEKCTLARVFCILTNAFNETTSKMMNIKKKYKLAIVQICTKNDILYRSPLHVQGCLIIGFGSVKYGSFTHPFILILIIFVIFVEDI